jgi:hypothetical protein
MDLLLEGAITRICQNQSPATIGQHAAWVMAVMAGIAAHNHLRAMSPHSSRHAMASISSHNRLFLLQSAHAKKRQGKLTRSHPDCLRPRTFSSGYERNSVECWSLFGVGARSTTRKGHLGHPKVRA